MDCNDQNNSIRCSYKGIILSIILGIVVGFLFACGYIAFIGTILWIIFGIGAFAFVYVLFYSLMSGITRGNNLSKCFCKNLPCLLGGVLGTIVSTIILMSNVILVECIFTSIMVGLTGFFFVLMLSGLVELTKCVLFCCK